jgi:hypothetical protein
MGKGSHPLFLWVLIKLIKKYPYLKIELAWYGRRLRKTMQEKQRVLCYQLHLILPFLLDLIGKRGGFFREDQ